MSEHDSTCALPELPKVTGVQFRHVTRFPRYCVSDTGEIWSSNRSTSGRWNRMKPSLRDGYPSVRIKDSSGRLTTVYVHAAVLTAFVGPRPEGMQACHFNGNRQDCRLGNLRWDTAKANRADQKRHGTSTFGQHSPFTKLSKAEVVSLRELHAQGNLNMTAYARERGVDESTIRNAITGKSWKVFED